MRLIIAAFVLLLSFESYSTMVNEDMKEMSFNYCSYSLKNSNYHMYSHPVLLPAVGWFAGWLAGHLLSEIVDRSIIGDKIDHVLNQIGLEKRTAQSNFPQSEWNNVNRIINDTEDLFLEMQRMLNSMSLNNEQLKIYFFEQLHKNIEPLEERISALEKRVSDLEVRIQKVEDELKTRPRINLDPEFSMGLIIADAYPLFADSKFDTLSFSSSMELSYSGPSVSFGVHYNYFIRGHMEIGYLSNWLDRVEERTLTAYLPTGDSLVIDYKSKGYIFKSYGTIFLPTLGTWGPEFGLGLRYSIIDFSINQSNDRIYSFLPYGVLGVRVAMDGGTSFNASMDLILKNSDIKFESLRLGIFFLLRSN